VKKPQRVFERASRVLLSEGDAGTAQTIFEVRSFAIRFLVIFCLTSFTCGFAAFLLLQAFSASGSLQTANLLLLLIASVSTGMVLGILLCFLFLACWLAGHADEVRTNGVTAAELSYWIPMILAAAAAFPSSALGFCYGVGINMLYAVAHGADWPSMSEMGPPLALNALLSVVLYKLWSSFRERV
jgi:magnesium-transporting ATPase (P-type)